MSDESTVFKDLLHKKRSVNDLMRFLDTRNDKISNYNVLLGAGCSVTSKIRSATELVREWKKEIFNLHNDPSTYTEDLANEFVRSDAQTSWFDPRSEYSSLFEKRYDLAKQRRTFIEEEVRNKNPSIGYAYLINLIKKKYINTIFTTNFDDLANEAFYLYTDLRPIVCAHDSTVSSITITSDRPKIIKLHGDFLFDDLKSTIRETESLEDNMKDKFQEFSKEFGLIVVGYAGDDRSIMDSLNYLLKNENNFKNGIYWCLRKGSNINTQLKNLLWKERVYWVEIEGFDELFAELHHGIMPHEPLVDVQIISNRSERILRDLESAHPENDITNDIISSDIKEIRERMKSIADQIINASSINNSDPKDEKLSKTNDSYSVNDHVIFIQCNDLHNNGKHSKTIELINSSLGDIKSDDIKQRLLRIKAKSFKVLNNYDDARTTIEELRRIGKDEYEYYQQIIGITEEEDDKLKLLSKCIEINPYYSWAYHRRAEILAKQRTEGSYGKSESIEKKIIDDYLTSLLRSPELTNQSYSSMLNFCLDIGSTENIDKLLELGQNQNPYDSDYLYGYWKYNKFSINQARKHAEELLVECPKNYELGILDASLVFINENETEESRDWALDLLEQHKEKIDSTRSLLYKSLNTYQTIIGFKEDSIRMAKLLHRRDPTDTSAKHLAMTYLYSNEIESAKKVIQDREGFWVSEMTVSILISEGKYKEALKEYMSVNSTKREPSEEAYLNLLCQNYQETIEIINQKCHIETTRRVDVLVNFELSKQNLGKSPNNKRINRILALEKEGTLREILDRILNKKDPAELIGEWTKYNLIHKHNLKIWPLFKDIKNKTVV